MGTTTDPVSLSAPFGGRVKITREMCGFLERGGLLPERYELVDGEIIAKMGQNYPYAFSVMQLILFLVSIFGANRVLTQTTMEVRGEEGITNHPEPDVVVLREGVRSLPETADVLVVAEVSDTTVDRDYGPKYHLYARTGIPEYWLLDINARRVTVFFEPDSESGEYGEHHVFGEADVAFSSLAPEQTVSVASLLA